MGSFSIRDLFIITLVVAGHFALSRLLVGSPSSWIEPLCPLVVLTPTAFGPWDNVVRRRSREVSTENRTRPAKRSPAEEDANPAQSKEMQPPPSVAGLSPQVLLLFLPKNLAGPLVRH